MAVTGARRWRWPPGRKRPPSTPWPARSWPRRWIAETGADISAADRPAAELADAGQTPVVVAVDGRLRLVLGVADALRPDTPAGITRLHGLGLEQVLATGDTQAAAIAAARAAGIGAVHAGLLPKDKSALVAQLRSERGPVAMVGDGIN